MRIPPIALLSLLLTALGGCGPDPAIELEAQLEQLRESTLPKERFWAEVERKGAAEKKLRELEPTRARQQRELAQQDARLTQLAGAVARAQQLNQDAEALFAHAEGRRIALEDEVAKLEARLVGWGATPSASDSPEAPAGAEPGSAPGGS